MTPWSHTADMLSKKGELRNLPNFPNFPEASFS